MNFTQKIDDEKDLYPANYHGKKKPKLIDLVL